MLDRLVGEFAQAVVIAVAKGSMGPGCRMAIRSAIRHIFQVIRNAIRNAIRNIFHAIRNAIRNLWS